MWYHVLMMQTLSTRTICCKLSLDDASAAAIRATAEAFNAAATYCAQVAWEKRITNKNKLHHVVYGPTRSEYGLGHNWPVVPGIKRQKRYERLAPMTRIPARPSSRIAVFGMMPAPTG